MAAWGCAHLRNTVIALSLLCILLPTAQPQPKGKGSVSEARLIDKWKNNKLGDYGLDESADDPDAPDDSLLPSELPSGGESKAKLRNKERRRQPRRKEKPAHAVGSNVRDGARLDWDIQRAAWLKSGPAAARRREALLQRQRMRDAAKKAGRGGGPGGGKGGGKASRAQEQPKREGTARPNAAELQQKIDEGQAAQGQGTVQEAELGGELPVDPNRSGNLTDDDAVRGCKVYMLDAGAIAKQLSLPACREDAYLAVNPGNGVVYLANHHKPTWLQHSVSHSLGANSGPWYAIQALQASGMLTSNISEADVVYVNDYCYLTWWLAHVHTLGRVHDQTPGDYLVPIYKHIAGLPEFRARQGRNFVFFQPHSGFASGLAMNTYARILCHDLQHAVHVVVWRAIRNMCWEMDVTVNPPLIHPIASLPTQRVTTGTVAGAAERNIFLFYKGRCRDWDQKGKGSAGQRMRAALAQAMRGAAPDVLIECTDETGQMRNEPHPAVIAKMQRTLFCLATPGDSQTSRRLTESLLAGCIPVFVGPPYHTLPFGDYVDYHAFSVFFNVQDTSAWLDPGQQVHWKLVPKPAIKTPQDAAWWVPDIDLDPSLRTVGKAADILPSLRSVPKREIRAMLAAVVHARGRFRYETRFGEPPSAVDTVIHHACKVGMRRP